MAVWIRTEPLPEVFQRRARGREVPRGLAFVLGLQEQPHLHRRQRGVLETFPPLDVVGTRRPGEVVNVFLVIMMRAAAVGLVLHVLLKARCTHHPALRHRQANVVDAKVGVELGRPVELVAVPAPILQHPELWKPLRDEVEVSDHPGARKGAGDAC
jgi:hypothetical protein